MATLSFSVQYNMSTPMVWLGSAETHTNDTLELKSATHRSVYTSGDASFRYKSGSLLPVSGTVSQFAQYEDLALQYQYVDGQFSIVKILSYLKKLDGLGLQQYLLSGDDTIQGSGGNDTLWGFKGNDVIEGDAGGDVLDGGDGIDTASYAGSATAVTVVINGPASGGDADGDSLSNFENLTGSASNDHLTGDAGANILDGGAGEDTLIGGDGNDTYVIDDAGDHIIEGNGKKSGIDLVQSSLSDYTLGENLENLTLIDIDDIDGAGNALKNIITGNDGDNVLDGGVGANPLIGDSEVDTLIGGKGNDTYIVDLIKKGASAKLGDKIVEKAEEGNDTLKIRPVGDLGLTKPLTLKLANYLENLDAGDTGVNPLNLTGNNLDNILTGNDAANILDGGKGADQLYGGAGADTYLIDDLNDTVHEVAGADIDLVKIKIAVANGNYTLGDHIEDAVLTSSVAFNVIGNDLINKITGNSKNNVIEGGDKGDTLDGGAGSDTVSYAGSSDKVSVTLNGKLQASVSGGHAEGDIVLNFENVTGSAFEDTLVGDAGANILDGGGGGDHLSGGDGNDTYVVDNIDDVIVEGDGKKAGTDTVIASIDYVLGNNSNLENLTLSGSANIDATGNDDDNLIIGNDGDNVLDGGLGKDTLKGGKGDDTYVLELIKSGSNAVYRDIFVENDNEGNDSLILHASGDLGLTSAAKLTLSNNIETIDASDTGSNKLNLIGNDGDNTLIGNAADNLLDGRGGKDILKGGEGDDTYIVDDLEDSIIETGLGDTDTVKITIAEIGSFTLGENLENATLNSSVDFDLIGNAANNSLTGNAKNNLIRGGGGADTMDGGDGIDTLDYLGSSIGVTIVLKGKTESTGSGGDADGDRFKNFENIIGSNQADNLTGDDGANRLDGSGGGDTMKGGKGNDTYVVDHADDDVIEDSAAGGIDTVESSVAFTLGDYLENLTLFGTNDINGTGNGLDNQMNGNNGINTLNGGGGNDTLIGGAGNDILEGGEGNDLLDGGSGSDTLTGGKGDDRYYVDLINSGAQVVFADIVTELANEGTDSLVLFNDRNVTSSGIVSFTLATTLENLDASQTTISQLNLLGNNSNNILIGNDGNNTLTGNNGNDTLKGGNGVDTLNGGADDDILIGGDGSDILTGGSGLDTFVFDVAPSKQNQDHITDFSAGNDRIHLKQSLFAGAGQIGKLNTIEFLATGSPNTGVTQHIIYDTDSGELWYNPDGSGSAALVLIAVLDNPVNLTNNNIYLI